MVKSKRIAAVCSPENQIHMGAQSKGGQGAGRRRHERDCRVCRHPQREQIERDFVAWHSPGEIAKEYKLYDRRGVYRHAHAVGLFGRRDRNIRAALARIIERCGSVRVTAAAVVQAAVAFSKINRQGVYVERTDTLDLNALFERMTRNEMTAYAERGELPDWFTQTVGLPVTGRDKEEG